jgi:hypothetical protein
VIIGLILLSFFFIIVVHVLSQEQSSSAATWVLFYFFQTLAVIVGPTEMLLGWLTLFNFNFLDDSAQGTCVMPLSPYEKLVLSIVAPWICFVQLLILMFIQWCICDRRCCRVCVRSQHPEHEPIANDSVETFSKRWGILFQRVRLPQPIATSRRCDLSNTISLWHFPVMMLVRRALVALVETVLILRPRTKFIAFGLLHLFWLVVHLIIKPFSHRLSHHLETVTLCMLVVLPNLMSISLPPFSMSGEIALFIVTLAVPTCLVLLAAYIYRRAIWLKLASIWKDCRHTLTTFDADAYWRTGVGLISLTYTAMATVALQYLTCVRVRDTEVIYFFPAVQCDDSRYTNGKPWIILQLVYLAAIPVAIFLFLLRHRPHLEQLHMEQKTGGKETEIFELRSNDAHASRTSTMTAVTYESEVLLDSISAPLLPSEQAP